MKTPFVTKEQLEQITKEFPTPFHLYDEKGKPLGKKNNSDEWKKFKEKIK